MKELNTFQKQFMQEIAAIQEETVQITLAENSDNSLQSDYYNITRFAHLLDKKTTGRPDEMIRRSFKTGEFKEANSVFKNTIDELIRNNMDLDKSQIKTLKRAKRGNPIDINFM